MKPTADCSTLHAHVLRHYYISLILIPGWLGVRIISSYGCSRMNDPLVCSGETRRTTLSEFVSCVAQQDSVRLEITQSPLAVRTHA